MTNLHMVGCTHRSSSLEIRERLAFAPGQMGDALDMFRQRFPNMETVVISTCNRVEIYTASVRGNDCPTRRQVVDFLADFHGLDANAMFDSLFEENGEDAVRHLFTVAASLDSLVVGEVQILSQVKQAYEQARANSSAGPLTHAVFQTALRVAKRVARETTIHRHRTSVPSVAVRDFAKRIFDRFDDKRVLVIGAGKMADETLRYLVDEGARSITVVNRSENHGRAVAARHGGVSRPWCDLPALIAESDLVVSATGSTLPVVGEEEFARIHPQRCDRPLLVLDLAVPRDFAPEIGHFQGVFLLTVDDLEQVCETSLRLREKELPKAQRIIQAETDRFMAELNHRSTGETIRRFKAMAERMKAVELNRLLNKLGHLDTHDQREITRSFDRLINKLLHPPLEALRLDSSHGAQQKTLNALRQLFKLAD